MTTASAPQPSPVPQLPPDAVMMQLLFGKMIVFAIGGIARLRVADHMEAEPRAVEEVASASAADPEVLYRVLRLLASVGLFVEAPGRRFALTPVGQLLRSDNPRSLRNMAIMQTDPWVNQSYGQMAHCIQTGGDGVTAAFGKHTFDLFLDIPDQAATFHGAMTDFTGIAAQALLKVADFSRFRRMADVGGGHGILLASILNRFPNLNGVLFDLPEVVVGASASGHFQACQDRIAFESGSFFERVPEGCDAYIMKSIIHDWDDANGARILQRMREQLARTAPENGRVFICEMVVPETPEPSPAKTLDINMLVMTRGGRERTAPEFARLLASAGFRLVSITPSPSPICLIEAAPE